ncbi:GNAT family N-acetyltransferase [Marinomonas sp. PE14-40]|uniref:GNAT family N-acetyltransferase n=1 Tax=Marinomonas sp. PE14-40 TaxID=3060621 RepID=UPI003F667D96
MSIRPFIKDDYSKILEIYAKSKLDELRFEKQEFELLPLESDATRLAELTESDIYVYEEAETVAYGAVYGNEIRALFVSPDARGKGIGKNLLEYLLSIVKEPISLYVAKTNLVAKSLYKNYGFKVVEEFKTDYNQAPVIANKMVAINRYESVD